MTILTVKTFLKELGEDNGGLSKPVVVIASDDNEYILKNQLINGDKNNFQTWDCMFLQEILVARLGEYLGVPMPKTAIVDVEKEHITNAPSLLFRHRYSPGKHFGSKFLSEIDNNLKLGYQKLREIKKTHIKTNWTNFFKDIDNPKDVARIIAMDLLIANFDRFGNEGNLMVSREDNKRRIYAIDHGHAFFGHSWEQMKIGYLSSVINGTINFSSYLAMFFKNSDYIFSGLGSMFRGVEQHINCNDIENHDFIEVVGLIESIDETLIDSWINEIPDEFFKDKFSQVTIYKKFILAQKNNIRGLLTMMHTLGAFSNSSGGELIWKNQKTGTQ